MLAIVENLQALLSDFKDEHSAAHALLLGMIFGLAAWSLARAVRLGFQRILEKPKYVPADRTAIRFLAQLSQLAIYLFAFLLYAHLIPALKSLGTAWLASVGVVSVV